jgi:7,8-dihydropterin-6-yl-methyl-4-(beta-D-ribofuranosyl)aminobenzene 5'-phosphate synthase
MKSEIKMKINILLENSKPKNSNLNIEHGLSILIQKDGYNLLFDIGGPKESAIINAGKLGIDLAQIDAAVISHGHNDHTGGLLKFMEINHNAPIYMKKEALNPYYSKRPEGIKYIGIDAQIVKKYSERFNFVTETIEVAPDIFLISKIINDFSIPSINKVLFTKKDEELINDNFDHELFMVILNNDNLVIFSGCGHNGIKNIINTAKNAFPGKRVDAVIGGFHFQAGSSDNIASEPEEVEYIAEWLKSEVDGQIFTGHCTGERGINLMKPILKEKLQRINTGLKISI